MYVVGCCVDDLCDGGVVFVVIEGCVEVDEMDLFGFLCDLCFGGVEWVIIGGFVVCCFLGEVNGLVVGDIYGGE